MYFYLVLHLRQIWDLHLIKYQVNNYLGPRCSKFTEFFSKDWFEDRFPIIWPQDSRDHVTDAEMTQKKRIRRCWKRTCEKKFFKVCRKIVQSSKEKKELVSAIEAPNCKRFKKLWQQLMKWGVAHTWAMKWRVKPGHYVA